MTVTAVMVKKLRDMTGAGMMDCKSALVETAGDVEAAIDRLRAKGLSKAAKKAGRAAAEGLVAVATDGSRAIMVEVNSETDFVARNPEFQGLVSKIAAAALTTDGSLDAVKAAKMPDDSATVEEAINAAIATIGENMSLRRTAVVAVENGVIANYVHGAVAPGLGKIGVLVGMSSSGKGEAVGQIGKQVAMHVAAANPLAVRADNVDADVAAREKAIFAEQARESGKPEAIIEKMVEGRMRKFYEEVALL
ncbi:MAG: translation elongation factor Ts, partial [Alphaproteobacteria bacterium]